MPTTPVPPDLDVFLRKANPAVIASLRPDGSPHTAATWYDWEDGRVLLNMDRTRVRLKYLERDPRVALTVTDGEDWYRHVSLLGRVVELKDDPDLADIDRLSMRYRGVPYWNRDRDSVTAWMVPDSWHGWGV